MPSTHSVAMAVRCLHDWHAVRPMSVEHRATRPRSTLWPYISLIPLGFGAWAPIYAGVKARRSVWIAARRPVVG